MRILVDADACPVKDIIVNNAKKHDLNVIMFFDTSHVYEDGYSTVHIVDKGPDSVDYFLINHLNHGDIVVTQDYGVASMALSKHAFPINHNGLIFTHENIMSLLNQRAFSQKARKQNKHFKGPKKRTKEMDLAFEKNLKSLINDNL